jgi:hypothetical protein
MNPTEKCKHCGAEEGRNGKREINYKCGSYFLNEAEYEQSDLCRERELRQKAEAELAETKLDAAVNRANFLNLAFGQRDPLMAENKELRELLERALVLAGDYYPTKAAAIYEKLNHLTK